MDPETSSFKSPIRQLTDNNYSEWLIDIKALLRDKKLWNYTQEAPDSNKSVAAQAKWRDSAMEVVDLITPTISGPIKQKLQANAFDDGYLIINSLANIYTPKGDAEFIQLTREYYSLRYEDFDSMTHYLTHIKTLEERIRGTNMVLDDDKQTLLCLDITLPEEFQYFTKIWAMTPGMTTNKARNMLLEEERRQKTLDIGTMGTGGVGLVTITRHPSKRTPSEKTIVNNMIYPRCGKDHEADIC